MPAGHPADSRPSLASCLGTADGTLSPITVLAFVDFVVTICIVFAIDSVLKTLHPIQPPPAALRQMTGADACREAHRLTPLRHTAT